MKHLDLDLVAGKPSTFKFSVFDDTGLPINLSTSSLVLEVFDECKNLALSKTASQTDVITFTDVDTAVLTKELYSYRVILMSTGSPAKKSYIGLLYVNTPDLYFYDLTLWDDSRVWNDDVFWIETV